MFTEVTGHTEEKCDLYVSKASLSLLHTDVTLLSV